MRANLYGLLAGALGAGILLRTLSTAKPSNAASTTQGVSDVLNVLSPVAGLLILLLAIGVLVVWTMPSRGGL